MSLYEDFDNEVFSHFTGKTLSGLMVMYGFGEGSSGVGGIGSSTFIDLTDTPSDYVGDSCKFLKVTDAEDGVEFSDVLSQVGSGVCVDGFIKLDSGVQATAIYDDNTLSQCDKHALATQKSIKNFVLFQTTFVLNCFGGIVVDNNGCFVRHEDSKIYLSGLGCNVDLGVSFVSGVGC